MIDLLRFTKERLKRGHIQPQDQEIEWAANRTMRKELNYLQAKANKEYEIAQGTYVPKKRGKNKPREKLPANP